MANPLSVVPDLAGATASKIRELPLVFRVLSVKSNSQEMPRPERLPRRATATSREKIITDTTPTLERDLWDASEIGRNPVRTGVNQ